jgi:hypothetical protein
MNDRFGDLGGGGDRAEKKDGGGAHEGPIL